MLCIVVKLENIFTYLRFTLVYFFFSSCAIETLHVPGLQALPVSSWTAAAAAGLTLGRYVTLHCYAADWPPCCEDGSNKRTSLWPITQSLLGTVKGIHRRLLRHVYCVQKQVRHHGIRVVACCAGRKDRNQALIIHS